MKNYVGMCLLAAAVGAAVAVLITDSPSAPLAGAQHTPRATPRPRTQGVMRRSLVPGQVAGGRTSLNQGENALALFEEGRVFGVSDGGPVERERLAILLSGPVGNWQVREAVGLTHLKGVVESLVERIGFPPQAWQRGGAPWLDEAEGAVLVGEDGTRLGIAGLLEGVKYIERMGGVEKIHRHEMELARPLWECIRDTEGVTLYCADSLENRTPVFSFTLEGFHDPAEIGVRLDVDYDVACRTGLQCAPLVHDTIGTSPEGTVRFSLGPMSTEADVQAAIPAVQELAAEKRK